MKRRRMPFGNDGFLSVLEGVEGGFAIFAGIVLGLSIEGVDRRLLLLTAGISIIVNAVNASAVRYASEHYLDELDGREKRSWFRAYFIPAATEFFVYGVASLISVIPLLFIPSLPLAVTIMIIITTAILYLSGWYRGFLLSRHHKVRDGVEVAGLGLLIILAGALSGWIISSLVA